MTADSSPGPRRSRDVHPDPMIAAAEARRRPSASNLNRHRSPSRLMSGSNPSLESQLAHDFQRHAPFAASSSATSLGRHGASHLSLHDSMPPVPPVPSIHQHGQGSAPPSPYGHPKAAAVANGAGMGRQVLPSIQQWDGDVNPMFKVVSPPSRLLFSMANDQPPAQQGGNGTTLPPFSAIAQVADNSPSHSRHGPPRQ
jgi:meiosis induction protein kinase IME2/SME1